MWIFLILSGHWLIHYTHSWLNWRSKFAFAFRVFTEIYIWSPKLVEWWLAFCYCAISGPWDDTLKYKTCISYCFRRMSSSSLVDFEIDGCHRDGVEIIGGSWQDCVLYFFSWQPHPADLSLLSVSTYFWCTEKVYFVTLLVLWSAIFLPIFTFIGYAVLKVVYFKI